MHLLSKQHLEYIGRWFCSSCNIQLYSANELEKHLTTSKHKTNSNTMFSCDLCKYTCGKETLLNQHNQTQKHIRQVQGVVKQAKFACQTCSYETHDKNHYNRHLLTKTHKDAEKGIFKVKLAEYTCEPCNYKTPFKQSLHTHTLSKKHQKNLELTT